MSFQESETETIEVVKKNVGKFNIHRVYSKITKTTLFHAVGPYRMGFKAFKTMAGAVRFAESR